MCCTAFARNLTETIPVAPSAPSTRQGSFDSVNPFASEWVVCAQDDIASCSAAR